MTQRALAVAIAALLLAGMSAPLAAREKPVQAQPFGEPLSRERLNWLVERDRPRDGIPDFSEGKPWSPKASKRLRAWIDAQEAPAAKAVADYRKTRSVKAWRAMLASVNQGYGLRIDDMIGGGILRSVFRTLHDVGPPVDDPENGGNAEFAARRHHAMLRLLARQLWPWYWATDDDQRVMAFYLQDCERRPSPDRPTGNNHDPDCGFIFEMDYKSQRWWDRAWEDENVPQSFAAFAARVPSNHPDPLVRMFVDYPLHLSAPPAYPNMLWAGNEAALAAQYRQSYVANRAYQEQRYAEHLAWEAAEREKRTMNAEIEWQAMQARQAALDERWDTLWASPTLTSTLQAELENIAVSLNRLDIYRTRYQIISYDRIAEYCARGYANECYRKMAMDDAANEQLMASRNSGGGGGGGSGGSQIVTVRNYDRNGNYTGSTVTTRIDAQLSGARPY